MQVQNFAKKLNKLFNSCQSILRFGQSGEISPTLVTLVGRVNNNVMIG